MILEAYDENSEAVISPAAFLGEPQHICSIAIPTFSREIYSSVLEQFPQEQIGRIRAANRLKPVYLLTVQENFRVVFYLSELGSALSSSDLIDVHWMTGAEHFILFGSAGSLQPDITQGKFVVPSEAYREEGMSYHYAPPSDYIQIRNADVVEHLFQTLHLPYVKGKVWTTDALYRETRNLVQKRKAEGCIAVEMELAGVQAVCDFYGIQLYDFLVTGDVVDPDAYQSEALNDANHNMNKFHIALQLAKLLQQQHYSAN